VGIITVITQIQAPIERIFDLARSIDLHVESAGQTGERAIGKRTKGLLAHGEEVTWRGKHFGVWQNFTSKITACDRPSFFRDSMRRGAFRRMDHDHYFQEVGNITVMRDVIDFTAPLGLLGWVADRLVLRRHLRQFLIERNAVLKRVAEGDDWRRFVGPG
jgi:ligand-binding SRPBCC domain-containing protein